MDIYNEFYINIYKNPFNYGKIEDADLVIETEKPSCGDKATIYLKINNGTIEKASFEGSGCVVSIVGTSLLMKDIEGKSLKAVLNYTPETLMELTGMDLKDNPSRIGCLTLALDPLKKKIRELL